MSNLQTELSTGIARTIPPGGEGGIRTRTLEAEIWRGAPVVRIYLSQRAERYSKLIKMKKVVPGAKNTLTQIMRRNRNAPPQRLSVPGTTPSTTIQSMKRTSILQKYIRQSDYYF
eukprot:scaffold13200_cov71-Skeletonema_marinoi.AAC.2